MPGNFLAQDLATLWRMRGLVWVLTRREIAARYAGTAAGIVWAYAQPLLMVAAYYLVFDVVFSMRLGEQAPTRRVGGVSDRGGAAMDGFLRRGGARHEQFA